MKTTMFREQNKIEPGVIICIFVSLVSQNSILTLVYTLLGEESIFLVDYFQVPLLLLANILWLMLWYITWLNMMKPIKVESMKNDWIIMFNKEKQVTDFGVHSEHSCVTQRRYKCKKLKSYRRAKSACPGSSSTMGNRRPLRLCIFQ